MSPVNFVELWKAKGMTQSKDQWHQILRRGLAENWCKSRTGFESVQSKGVRRTGETKYKT